MKLVDYTDQNGFKHKVLIKDGDGEEMAPYGVPVGPPDLDALDWEYLKREMNNALFENELFTWDDVQRSQIGVQPALTIMKRALIALYRDRE